MNKVYFRYVYFKKNMIDEKIFFWGVISILVAIEYNTNKTMPVQENESVDERKKHEKFAFWSMIIVSGIFVFKLISS